MDLEPLWTCVGRRDDYAVQQSSGRYFRRFRPVDATVLATHLTGQQTIGTYVLSETGTCSFAVFDADREDGLTVLKHIQTALLCRGYPSYLERSRRGGHLWIFFVDPTPAQEVRAWLWPLAATHNLELFPKQAGGQGIGSLIRLPLGIHRRSGQRYPFVDASLQPVAHSLSDMLEWLAQVKRVTVPSVSFSSPAQAPSSPLASSTAQMTPVASSTRSIRDWNKMQNPFTLIGRYVALDHRGRGCCPFPEHHQRGHDAHPSFHVFSPRYPGGSCWRCYTWGRGGSAFDFLRYWYHLDARTLWLRILSGEIDG